MKADGVQLKAAGIRFSYAHHEILKGLDLELQPGKLTALLGPNGSGKTTLMKCLNGLLKVKSGSILLNEIPIERHSNASLAKMLAYVPQFHNITFPLTLFEAVLLGRQQGYAWRHSPEDLDITAGILEELELIDLAERPVNHLSGGEQQKGAIARALAQETPLILLDEPTSNLDIKHQYEIMNLMTKYSKDDNKGILIVLHDINIAAAMADHLIVMKDGHLVKEGHPDDIISTELIESVYGIGAEIVSHMDRPHLLVTPLKQSKEE